MLIWCESSVVVPREYERRLPRQLGCVSNRNENGTLVLPMNVPAVPKPWGSWFGLANVNAFTTSQIVAFAQAGIPLGIDELTYMNRNKVDWLQIAAALKVRSLFALGDVHPITLNLVQALKAYPNVIIAPELYIYAVDGMIMAQGAEAMLDHLQGQGWFIKAPGEYTARFCPIFNIPDSPQYNNKSYSCTQPTPGWRMQFVYGVYRRCMAAAPWMSAVWGDSYATDASRTEFAMMQSQAELTPL